MEEAPSGAGQRVGNELVEAFAAGGGLEGGLAV
jgi:hypothetical protein